MIKSVCDRCGKEFNYLPLACPHTNEPYGSGIVKVCTLTGRELDLCLGGCYQDYVSNEEVFASHYANSITTWLKS
jgi:hypothetical protein